MTRVCVASVDTSLNDFIQTAGVSQAMGADMMELRLDHLENLEELAINALTDLKAQVQLPIIATLRPDWAGGMFSGSEGERLRIIDDLIETKAFDFIDIELDLDRIVLENIVSVARKFGVKAIISYHDHQTTPGGGAMFDMIKQCLSFGDVGKIAVTVTSGTDLRNFFEGCRLCRGNNLNFIAIGMGGLGAHITRILAPVTGSELVYVSSAPDKESAPGQIDLRKLHTAWDIMQVRSGGLVQPDEETLIYGLIGKPLAHSLSPLMHNAAFKFANLNSIYLPFEVDAGDLGAAIDDCRALGVRGLNVTAPYKERVLEHLDDLEESAEVVGAVNTIVNRTGKLVGHNTDTYGAAQALKIAAVEVKGRNALVIGAGGAAKAVCHVLDKRGACIAIANRTRASAEALKDMFDKIAVIDLEKLNTAIPENDLIINCTPLGILGSENLSMIDQEHFTPQHTVFDLVYNPEKTLLLQGAEMRGARTVSGLEMFVYQGMKAFELWTGLQAPYDIMKRVSVETSVR